MVLAFIRKKVGNRKDAAAICDEKGWSELEDCVDPGVGSAVRLPEPALFRPNYREFVSLSRGHAI